ncbi:Cysteine-rich secretory protein [Trinorchestia longiramus]|nr:Cysteine-rich secretory protein [Trinorchestia longiramus]
MQLCTSQAVLLLFFLASALQITAAWRNDRRPKIFGSRLQLRSLTPRRMRIRRRLVQYHNFFRTRVQPPATNMLAMVLHLPLMRGNRHNSVTKMLAMLKKYKICRTQHLNTVTLSLQSWSREAARDAQRWASACKLLVHDDNAGRTVRGYGPCGQNIFVGTQQVPWFFAVKTWWLEKDNFTYGSEKNDLFVVGHYTQLVWHASHQMGCGLAFCKDAKPRPFYNYVCNYCPIGNHLQAIGHPYDRGPSCSACPGHCKADKLCTNACPFGDLWVNCKDLARTFKGWLCDSKTKKGIERRKHCRATCRCEGKITFP